MKNDLQWANLFTNYCGLGGKGPVINEIDALCKEHDEHYTELIGKGKNPYTSHNEADEIFINKIKCLLKKNGNPINQLVGNVANAYFKAKKAMKIRGQKRKETEGECKHCEESEYCDIHDNLYSSLYKKHKRGQSSSEDSSISNYSLGSMRDSSMMEQQGHGSPHDTAEKEPGTEQAIEKIGHVWKRFPNHETAELKWIYTQIMGGIATANQNKNLNPLFSQRDQQSQRDGTTSGTYVTAAAEIAGVASEDASISHPTLMQFRMTSPYDIVNKSGTNIATSSNSQPYWLGLFDSKYQFYHTLKAKWKLSFTIGTQQGLTNAQDFSFYVYWKYTSFDNPPTSYVIDTSGTTGLSTTQYCTPDDYDRMRGWNKIHICANTTHNVTKVITGEYETGQCQMDVKMLQDTVHANAGTLSAATSEGWTPVQSTVAFPENLSVIIVQDNAVALANANPAIGIRAEIDYLIQFRDLNAYYKFPTQSYTMGGALDERQYFYRGTTNNLLTQSQVATTNVNVGYTAATTGVAGLPATVNLKTLQGSYLDGTFN